jgi:predicted MFS family arabinose efflux permease
LRRSNHINGYFVIPSRKTDVPLTPSHAPARDTSADLSRAAILIFAIACGVCVANVYFPQALSPLIARQLHAAPATAALLVTATQLGYAAGLYLLVPLGDRVRPRLLIVTLIILTAAGLVGAGTAPTLAVLLVAGTAVGVTTVVPQILLPMAAGLVPDQRRGAVTGTLLSGLLGGILLARTFSGALGGWLDWRAPYLVAAVLMVILAFVLTRVLPVTSPPNREHYGALLAAPVRLLRAEPDLRRSCVYQALMFGTFSAAWTAIALLLTGPSYGLSTQAVGVFALIGAGAVLVTPVAGRRIDRVGPDRISLVSFTGGLGSAAILALAALPALHGAGSLILLGAGMLLLDVAVQCGQVANQARIFGLPGAARARRNTAYMTCTFLGGSAGSWLGVRAYSEFGWGGIAGLTVLASAAALTRHLAHRRSAARPAAAQIFIRPAAGHRDEQKTSSPAGPSAPAPGCRGLRRRPCRGSRVPPARPRSARAGRAGRSGPGPRPRPSRSAPCSPPGEPC